MVTKILKFSAPWCGPCKQLTNELKNFNETLIESINIEEDSNNICEKYNIRSVPTLIFLDENEREIDRSIGFLTKTDILNIIHKFDKK